jgi:hypothetical protein
MRITTDLTPGDQRGAMRNLATKEIDFATKDVGPLILMVFGVAKPSDLEWTAFLGRLQRRETDGTAHLISTSGGAPSAAQRRSFNELFDCHATPLAVISASAGLPLSLWMHSCYDRQVHVFQPSEVREAIASLPVPASRIDFLTRELRSLRETLHAVKPASDGGVP